MRITIQRYFRGDWIDAGFVVLDVEKAAITNGTSDLVRIIKAGLKEVISNHGIAMQHSQAPSYELIDPLADLPQFIILLATVGLRATGLKDIKMLKPIPEDPYDGELEIIQ